MAKEHPLEIEEIEDYSGTHVFISKGHHDPIQFVAAINEQEGIEYQPSDVTQGYARIFSNYRGYDRFWQQCERGRGAVPFTAAGW